MATTEQVRFDRQGLASRPEIDSAAIRLQLERVLTSPSFLHSKRYPRFLRFVVDQTIHGKVDSLKERVLGIEVFDRSPNYDLTTDPIVRVAAGEIRKRLAQYYVQPGCENELRIELQAGSYVPEFRWPQAHPIPAQPPTANAPENDTLKAQSRSLAVSMHNHRRLTALAAALALTAAIAIIRANWQTPIDRFWGMIRSGDHSPLICLGDAGFFARTSPASQSIELKDLVNRNDLLALPDVIALNRISNVVLPRGAHIIVQNSASTTLTDLRQEPVILIGGRDNQWSMRAMQKLRYQIINTGEGPRVGIRDASDNKILWEVDFGTPGNSIPCTYALVARFYDSTTGQPAILAAGIGPNGTLSAAEFLTTSSYIREFVRNAPRGWEKKNVEIVLETQIIKDDNGPPHIVASYYW